MGTNGKVKTVLAVILSVVLLLGVVSWQKAQAQHKYTAEEVSNLVFNDALYLLRTVFVSSVFTQINNRRYQMDEIFNMVYDDVNHSLRVTVLADSAHEFRALWSDTVLARLYATKDGACIYFWMRGVHGDTIAKFEDRHHNIMAYLDSMKEWHASGYDLWTWTAPTPTTKRKIWTRNDTLFWNDSSGVNHPVYPSVAPPSASTSFGDTNAYFASYGGFGTGRDSVAGWYFSGPGAIQKAINAASAAADTNNCKTVYIMEGKYAEPCTIKSYVNVIGSGVGVTILDTKNNAGPAYTARGARNFSVENLSIRNTDGYQCTLATYNCHTAIYRNVDYYTSGAFTSTAVFRDSTTDTLMVSGCFFGRDGGVGIGAGRANVMVQVRGGGLLIMRDTRVFDEAGGSNAFTINENTGGCVVDIANCEFSNPYGTGASIVTGAYYATTYNFNHCVFRGQYNSVTEGGAGVPVSVNMRSCNFVGSYTTTVSVPHIFTGSAIQSYGYVFGTGTWELGSGQLTGPFGWSDGSVAGGVQGFTYGSISFDTANGLYATVHNGLMQYKTNGANDTLYLYADGAWRAVYPSSKGIADSARYLYGGLTVPGGNRITLAFTNKNLMDISGVNHTWDIGSATCAPDTVFCSAVVGASDLHLYSGGVVQMQGTVAAIGSQGTYGAVPADTQRVYGRMLWGSTAGWWSATDTVQFGLSNDTLTLDSRKNAAFLDLRELTVLFKSGWMLFDQIKSATNDSASSSLGSASVPYAFGYFSDGLYSDTNRSFSGKPIINRVRDSLIIEAWETKAGLRKASIDSTGNFVASSIVLGSGGGDINAGKFYSNASAVWVQLYNAIAPHAVFVGGRGASDSTGCGVWIDSIGGITRIRPSTGKLLTVKADTVDYGATVAAGALAGTLLNSPVLGDPTVWIAIKVGGVTKYVPAW